MISYKRLWKLLIDKDMKKKDLCEKAEISTASINKMGKNGHDNKEILGQICNALGCDFRTSWRLRRRKTAITKAVNEHG